MLKSCGNISHNAIYMGKHKQEHALPNGSDIAKLKDFIRMKYVDRRWYDEGIYASRSASNDTADSMPAKVPPSLNMRSRSPQPPVGSSSIGRGSLSIKSPAAVAPPVANPPPASSTFGMDLLSLDSPKTMPTNGHATTAPGHAPVFDPFSSSPEVSTSGGSVFDPFTSSSNTTGSAAFDPFSPGSQVQSDPFAPQTTPPPHTASSSGFTPFVNDGFNNQQQQPQQFDVFNSTQNQYHHQQQQQFSSFGNNSPGPLYPQAAPLPYIRVAPPSKPVVAGMCVVCLQSYTHTLLH